MTSRHVFTYFILLFTSLGLSSAQPVRVFGFSARFQRAPQPSGDLLLQKGTVLQPIHPQHRELIFQSVVLCKDVVLHFDNGGVSKPAKIEGFCNNPGLPVPPAGVEWQVAELASPQVRERCDSKIEVGIRKEHRPKDLWRKGVDPLRLCKDKTREECIEDFDAWLRTERHKDYLTLRKTGACIIKIMANPAYSAYGLYCNPLP